MTGFRTQKVAGCVCCARSWDTDGVTYRARGLCIDCYILEGGRLNQWAQLWLSHPPNGGNRDYVTAAIMRSQGVRSGVPDVLIFSVPPRAPGARGVTCGWGV